MSLVLYPPEGLGPSSSATPHVHWLSCG